MSWFNIPYSKKVIEKEEKAIKRRYGKVINRVNESKELDSISILDILDIHDDVKGLDDNIDEKIDYSDLEDY